MPTATTATSAGASGARRWRAVVSFAVESSSCGAMRRPNNNTTTGDLPACSRARDARPRASVNAAPFTRSRTLTSTRGGGAPMKSGLAIGTSARSNPRTAGVSTPADALSLAERARAIVEERLTFRDYRTDQRGVVTVSVGLASARSLEGEPIDHEKFSAAAEAALEQAKVLGRNRVERIELQPRLISLDEAAVLLRTDLQGIEKLVAEGRLNPVTAGRHERLERNAVRATVPESN